MDFELAKNNTGIIMPYTGSVSIHQDRDSIKDKLGILADAAKYDVACTSSGVERKGNGMGMGNCLKAGICHSFSSDGRCISGR